MQWLVRRLAIVLSPQVFFLSDLIIEPPIFTTKHCYIYNNNNNNICNRNNKLFSFKLRDSLPRTEPKIHRLKGCLKFSQL